MQVAYWKYCFFLLFLTAEFPWEYDCVPTTSLLSNTAQIPSLFSNGTLLHAWIFLHIIYTFVSQKYIILFCVFIFTQMVKFYVFS